MPPGKSSIEASIAVAREVVQSMPRNGLRAAVLFGSVAWGDADESSDLDLMLLLDHPSVDRSVARVRLADLVSQPTPGRPRFIDIDRWPAEAFLRVVEQGGFVQRIVNSIVLLDTDGWYGEIRRRVTIDYATTSARRTRWQRAKTQIVSHREAMRRALDLGDPTLAAIHARLAVQEATSGLVDLNDDRVSLTHFVENAERAFERFGSGYLATWLCRALVLDAPTEASVQSLRTYRQFADTLAAWMAEPAVNGRFSPEDIAWATFTHCAETYDEIEHKVTMFRATRRQGVLQYYLDGLLLTPIRMNLGKVLRLRAAGAASTPTIPEFHCLLSRHPTLVSWSAALRLPAAATRLDDADELTASLLRIGDTATA